MTSNLGASSLRKKRRGGDPMTSYDALPAPLRKWLSEAALPWSPTSARRIWAQSMARGLTIEETLRALCKAEARMLARDRWAQMRDGATG